MTQTSLMRGNRRCPVCGKVLPTVIGRRVHESRVHGKIMRNPRLRRLDLGRRAMEYIQGLIDVIELLSKVAGRGRARARKKEV